MKQKKILLGLVPLFLCFTMGVFIKHASAATSPFTMKFDSQSTVSGSYLTDTFKLTLDPTSRLSSSWVYDLPSPSSPDKLVCALKLTIDGAAAQNGSGTGTVQAVYKKNASSKCDTTYSGEQAIGNTSGAPPPQDKIVWTGAQGVLSADGSQIDVTFSDGSKETFTDTNTSDLIINFKPQSIGSIGGATVASWCSNTVQDRNNQDTTHGITLSAYTDNSGSISVCYSNGSTQINQPTIKPPGQPISIHVDTSAYTAKVSGTSAPDNSCAAQFNHPFAWAICPALDLADSAAGAFNSFIENQMCFNTGSTSSTGGVVCSGQNNLTDSVHRSWSIFRNIATVLLVLVMLIMVISQAIGGGPFDAYTVRKLLPKIVAAVIIMQLSWVLFKWAIDLSNDLGIAIRDLMFAPFGGGGKLQLDQIVGTNLGTHTAGTNDTFAFFAVLAGGVGLFALSIPGLAMLAFYAVMALLTAFIVLIFRKLLLIMLIIAAPLALVAWILPGTERYWKLWSDNFTKLLLMFPMIMGLIAAGRIFASITAGNTASMFSHPLFGIAHLGNLPVPYVASVTGFVDLAIIVVAYFGPYFLLPQTYKWGGAAMGAAARGVQKGVERAGKPAKDYLDWRKGLTPWKQARGARRAKQELRAKTDFYGGLSATGLQGRIRRARLGGIPRPTPGGVRDERALRDSIVSGGAQRAEEEALKEANQALQQELSTNPDALANHDQFVIDIARAGPGENVHGRVRSEADWRAAVEQMYTYGGPNNRVFEELNTQALTSGDPAARARWEKITNALAPQIIPKFPFVHKDGDYSQRNTDHTSADFGALGDMRTTVSQLTPESFTKSGIEGEAVETIMGHLSTLIREGATPGATAAQISRGNQARDHVATMYTLFNQTVTNEATRGNVNPAAGRAMIAAATGTGAVDINRGRGAPGVPLIEYPVIVNAIATSTDPDIHTAVANILATVRPDGNPR